MTDEPITTPSPAGGGQIAQARDSWIKHGYDPVVFDAAVGADSTSPTGPDPAARPRCPR